MTPPDHRNPDPRDPAPRDEIRRRQKGRALVMALALAAFVLLLYFITIARMGLGR